MTECRIGNGEGMRELFYKLRDHIEDKELMVITVIEGKCFGEKALISGNSIIWESEQNGFFTRNIKNIKHRASTGKLLVGNTMTFCDVIAGTQELIICGGGHVSMAILAIGKMLGFSTTVIEDRPYFADMARQAHADRVICMPFAEALDDIEGTADSYFAVVTRGHRYDQVCLEKILDKEYAYLGMMGSRGRVAVVKENLEEKGFDKERIDTLHSPIGLSIKAETPAEIAVSVMAEIIQVKNSKKHMTGYSKEIMEEIVDTEETGIKRILSTIVSRKGSAPRAVGTKMLILPDGRTKGTIGGGCMEAEVTGKALMMLRNGKSESKIISVDMSGEEAEEEGMACGGNINVLLEVI